MIPFLISDLTLMFYYVLVMNSEVLKRFWNVVTKLTLGRNPINAIYVKPVLQIVVAAKRI